MTTLLKGLALKGALLAAVLFATLAYASDAGGSRRTSRSTLASATPLSAT